jgi:hypothetical protein
MQYNNLILTGRSYKNAVTTQAIVSQFLHILTGQIGNVVRICVNKQLIRRPTCLVFSLIFFQGSSEKILFHPDVCVGSIKQCDRELMG